MRPVVHMLILLCLCSGMSASPPPVFADTTTADSARGLAFTVHPEALGGSVGTPDQETGSFWRGHAAARIEHTRWDGHCTVDFIRGTGPALHRAMEAGYDRRQGNGNHATRLRTRWSWQPLSSVGIALGRDTLHDGWGRRSLFRGRHAAPTPFLEVNLDGGGRLRYRHRIEALQGAASIHCWTGATGDPHEWIPPKGRMRASIERMVVSHRLEVDLGQRITGVLWGAVVWNTEDARGFEPHYLLPLTSLRPTEYAQGSSDNALVGLEGRLRLGRNPERNRHLYGQLLLDELIVAEILGSTGWWGNKYGMLGGLYCGYPAGSWRVELVGVRPWTYSHYTPTSAYITGLTPLAHPLGANFMEGSVQGDWQMGPWRLQGRCTASIRGDDPDGDDPTGSRPQIGDIDRTRLSYDWLNGSARQFMLVQLDAGRPVKLGSKTFLQAFARMQWRQVSNGPDQQASWQAIMGLRSTGPFFGADW